MSELTTELAKALRDITSLDEPTDQSTGTTVADLALGFTPLGPLQATRDYIRAKGDPAKEALAAASLLPIGPIVKALRKSPKAELIAGRGSATANLDRLEEAKSQLGDIKWGIRPTNPSLEAGDVYRQTGWYKGPEGVWKHEIPDVGFGLNPYKVEGGRFFGKAGDALDHDELFKAYPYLKDLKLDVRHGPGIESRASFFAGTDRKNPGLVHAATSTYDDLRKGIAHELQHAIQQHEPGFSRGSTPRIESSLMVNDALKGDPVQRYMRRMGEAEARVVETRLNRSPEYRAKNAPELDYDKAWEFLLR